MTPNERRGYDLDRHRRPVDWRSRGLMGPNDPWFNRCRFVTGPDDQTLGRSWGRAIMAARRLRTLPPFEQAVLQARLLAREPDQSIAVRYWVSAKAIRAYRAFYFDIDGRPTLSLLLHAVSPEAPMLDGSIGSDPCVQIRYFAFTGGLLVMERILEVLRDPDRKFDLSSPEGLRTARAWQKVKVVLMIRSLPYGDPVLATKQHVLDRLIRQSSETPRRPLWRPLTMKPVELSQGLAKICQDRTLGQDGCPLRHLADLLAKMSQARETKLDPVEREAGRRARRTRPKPTGPKRRAKRPIVPVLDQSVEPVIQTT